MTGFALLKLVRCIVFIYSSFNFGETNSASSSLKIYGVFAVVDGIIFRIISVVPFVVDTALG